jgi:hypothetical protein
MTPKVGGCPRQGAASNKLANASLVPLSNDPLDDLAKEIDGSFVLVVKLSGGKYRRRCFLTAAAAERAARNAQDAGHNATVFLAELKPLWRLAGYR